MQNRPLRFGPIALTNAVANLLNPGTTTGGVGVGSPLNCYILLRHIRIVNKTAGAVTFSLYIGATGASAAGTEFMGGTQSIPANSSNDWFAGAPGLRLDVADFLTGLASANTSLTIEGEGEIGLV